LVIGADSVVIDGDWDFLHRAFPESLSLTLIGPLGATAAVIVTLFG
jgi:hypothetical protein